MNFLKTLFWVVVAASLAIFATRNWNDVTLTLWGSIQAEVKLPFLLIVTFLLGFVPPYFVMRGRVWRLKRKLAIAERPTVPPPPVSDYSEAEEGAVA